MDPGDTGFELVVARVIGLRERTEAERHLPLDIRGTAFQHRVWKELSQIPLGSTANYTEIACRIGHPKAVRVAARACAAKLAVVVVPRHRVAKSGWSAFWLSLGRRA